MSGSLVEVALSRRLAAELAGTALLLATVVGSGIMGDRLASGNVAIALLANTVATGAVLVALILALGPLSGAHFNPAVSLVETLRRRMSPADMFLYVAAQVLGALMGVVVAHAMFGEPLLALSRHVRSGPARALSELVATFGLLLTILATSARRPHAVPYAVGAWITAAYWFTASTSFANPAVTLARSLTDTFAGIRPVDVPVFVVAQLAGAVLALAFHRWLAAPAVRPEAEEQARALELPGAAAADDGTGLAVGLARTVRDLDV